MAKTSPFITQLARSLATHAAEEGVLAKGGTRLHRYLRGTGGEF